MEQAMETTGMEMGMASSQSSKKHQAGRNDLPDLFKAVKIGIGLT